MDDLMFSFSRFVEPSTPYLLILMAVLGVLCLVVASND